MSAFKTRNYGFASSATLATVLLASVLSFSAYAQDNGFGLGTYFSPKGVGADFSYTVPSTTRIGKWDSDRSRKGSVTYDFRILADFEGILQGDHTTPGIRSQFLAIHTFSEKILSSDILFRLIGGPGLNLGYVRDRKDGWGYIGGLSGTVAVEFDFPSRTRLQLGLDTDISIHAKVNSKDDTKLTFYENGIRNLPMPYISISYSFNQKPPTRITRSQDRPMWDGPRVNRNWKNRFVWGIEWGTTTSCYAKETYTFQNEEMIAIEGSNTYTKAILNGFIEGSLGFMLTDRILLSVQAGWQGIYDTQRIYPVTMRATYYFKPAWKARGIQASYDEFEKNSRNEMWSGHPANMGRSKPFVLLEGGLGIPQCHQIRNSSIGKAGAGYSFQLGLGTCLELALGVQEVLAHPQIYDYLQGEIVPDERVWESRSYYTSIFVSAAIKF